MFSCCSDVAELQVSDHIVNKCAIFNGSLQTPVFRSFTHLILQNHLYLPHVFSVQIFMDLTVMSPLLSSSVLISYSHTYNSELKRSPLSIVTALVDKIDMRQHVIYPDCDIKFTGHVTWVGKSSIEAKIHMSQYRDGAYASVLDATFVMVARDPGNKRYYCILYSASAFILKKQEFRESHF
uniref:HotDog ACOT-type domain-containing protein n=1 Tax=Neolamprologus brichardi TaxID=32507 RepID=A0A3Q4MIE5_NEOBR